MEQREQRTHMAKLFPQWLPESERARPGRRAEILVYDKLAEQLGNKWLVIYGAAIKYKHSYGVSDRETEFVIAHPDLGVLFLEVKGGAITREGNNWFTTPLKELTKPQDQRLRKPLSKSPYTQVTDSAKAYKRKVQAFIATQRLPEWSFEFATAVCFPDIEIPDNEYLGADALPELTLDRNALDNLQERLYQILKIYQGKMGTPPGENGIEILQKVLARDWHIDSYLGFQIEDVEKKRRQLTEEQFSLLYDMEDNPKMLIRGCAGSGKTLLAARKAQQLASLGQKVLLTCFNENLAKWLQTSDFMHANILPAHFHGLCYQVTSNSKVAQLPRSFSDAGIDKNTYYKKLMPEALELAALEKEMSFDAIIVDEGQDFESTWFSALHNLLKDQENGAFYIFYDDNQRIYTQENIPFSWFKYRLSKNMRNTDQIFSYVQKYYHQPDIIKSSGLSGPDPWFVDLRDYENEFDAVQDVLNRLTQQKIRASDIAILTPRSKETSTWQQKQSTGTKFKIVWNLETFGNQVACCSIYSFKGLEKNVVILTELDHLYHEIMDELLYVGISRARNYLIILGRLPQRRGVKNSHD